MPFPSSPSPSVVSLNPFLTSSTSFPIRPNPFELVRNLFELVCNPTTPFRDSSTRPHLVLSAFERAPSACAIPSWLEGYTNPARSCQSSFPFNASSCADQHIQVYYYSCLLCFIMPPKRSARKTARGKASTSTTRRSPSSSSSEGQPDQAQVAEPPEPVPGPCRSPHSASVDDGEQQKSLKKTKTHTHLTPEQEDAMVEWLKANEVLYDKKT